MSQCRMFEVSGRVQGVFFRASTCDQARRLGLTGWVRNLPGGNVELLACGEETALAHLEDWLHQGPPMAKVTQVVMSDAGAQDMEGFRIV
ncbi:MAG TPA: acylphosphatase [Acidiferrobacteraceae bacterium]|nr:acylphosphatase [Acidiferrobacteraceae bacterium]